MIDVPAAGADRIVNVPLYPAGVTPEIVMFWPAEKEVFDKVTVTMFPASENAVGEAGQCS